MTCNLKVYSAVFLKLDLGRWRGKGRGREIVRKILQLSKRDTGNLSRLEINGARVSSLMSMYFFNVALTAFPYIFVIEGERKR